MLAGDRRGGAARRASGARRARRAVARLSDRRRGAVRLLGLHRGAAVRRGRPVAAAARGAGAALGRGGLRDRRDRRLRGGQPGGREHGPPRGAGRRGRCWPWGSPAGGRWRSRSSPCRCSTGNGWRPSATCPRRPETRPCTPPTTSRCSPSSSGARAERPVRVEIPPTRNRWEADYVAPRFPLARGWLRQLESDDSRPVHRREPDRGGVSVLARRPRGLLRRGRRTPSSTTCPTDEEALIRRGLPYLRAVWSDEHWRLYRVERSHRPGLARR